MKRFRLNIIFFTFFLLTGICSIAQEYRVGGSIIYNLKTNGLGFGIRTEFPIQRIDLLEGFSVVPQVTYFPGFNDISEFYLGSSLHLGIYKLDRWSFYGLANVSYNGWINHEDSTDPDAKFSNLSLDGGVGVTMNTCWRPFLELRLDAIGFEPSIRIGLLYTVNCDRRGMVPCSKIPAQPQF